MNALTISPFSRYLACLLALMLAIQPSISYGAGFFMSARKKAALPTHEPDFDGQAFEGIDNFAHLSEAANDKELSEYLTEQIRTAEPTNIQKVNASGDKLVDLMVGYKNFFAESLRKIDQEIQSLGYDKWFKERLNLNKVRFTDPKFGTMRFTSIDGQPVAKVVHKKSGVAFIIYDEERVSRKSKHFQTYISRQHYDAGSSRKQDHYKDKNNKIRRIKYGRDTLIMGINGNPNNPDNIEVAPRKQNAKNWWRATFKRPDANETVMGFASGLAQFASVWALAEMVGWILPGYEAGSTPATLATFTLAYGAVFGIWNSFYQNWRVRGPQWVQSVKNMSVSLGYYFGVSVISTAGLQDITVMDLSIDPNQTMAYLQNLLASAQNVNFESVVESSKAAIKKISSIGTPEALGFAALIHPFHNFIANNELKNWTVWNQRIEELERRDLHNVFNVKFPVPILLKDPQTGHRKLGTKTMTGSMGRRLWNRQFLYYLPVNWTKFLDQVWFTTTVGPAIAGEYPWWTPLISMVGFWGITAGAIRHTNWNAYRNHKRAAKKLKIKEGSYRYYVFDRLFKSVLDIFKSKKQKECDQLLSQDNKGSSFSNSTRNFPY